MAQEAYLDRSLHGYVDNDKVGALVDAMKGIINGK